MKLTPAQEAEYKFLKQQVDRWQDESMRRDADPYASTKLFYAREELRIFVSRRRAEGVNI